MLQIGGQCYATGSKRAAAWRAGMDRPDIREQGPHIRVADDGLPEEEQKAGSPYF
jgi:hypothetical protein